MGILEKIAEIEREISRTQKNKATEYHLGLLKAKLAKYRAQLLEPSKSAGAKGEGFDVMKSGDARVALIGFPSVGKSTFLSLMTSTESEAASYEFTTLTCIPGVITYKGANIQLLDLPGIIEGAAQGKGRGRQVIAVARTADVVIMMLDATKGDVQRELLEKELESVGIRLNRPKPNIYFKPKKGGGLSYNSTVPLTHCSEKLVQLILHEYSILWHSESRLSPGAVMGGPGSDLHIHQEKRRLAFFLLLNLYSDLRCFPPKTVVLNLFGLLLSNTI
uniref:Developmentally regulated GTP binding protein 2 n=1 Tax=Cyprinus carpio TaxID=7962 RepID=A0A8C2G476_CYPCA